ncbi:MAG: DegT/DnrJ/EryC1/StrS aminotransferase family protein [Betaproteobacteria bacterium]|nr:DegT/DnrJ/EryC1/StrS aminotransferase family protein [Betaproteobacteria bacterium]
MVEFQPILADARDYPAPRVPMLPQRLAPGRNGRDLSAFLTLPAMFERGAYALAEALRRCGVGPRGAVLLPAFHCRLMVEPALFLHAEPRFYPMDAALRPDFDALARLCADGRVKALVLVHYFGFPNALGETARFCQERGLTLIEDCAHALYGRHEGRTLGTTGRYATASLWKFLPVPDGGVLRDNGAEPVRRARHPSLKAELRAVANALRTRAFPAPETPPAHAGESAARARAASHAPIPAPQGLHEFQPAHADLGALRWSRVLAAVSDHALVAERRRAHYRRWLAALTGMPGVRPLHPELPQDVVPYAFPLLADAAGLAFRCLRMAGIPMWRWEDMAATDCPVAARYRTALLQLPCHQGLTDAQADWMVNTARAVLTEARLEPMT